MALLACLAVGGEIESAFGTGPAVTALFPAGGRRGTSVAVQLIGSVPKWPVQAWTASTDLTIAVDEAKGKLTVAISDDARPGVHWLRVFDDRGASRLRPFVVETVRELVESDAPQVVPLDEPCIINGRLRKANEVDTYTVYLQAGQTLCAVVHAHQPLGSPMDAVMQLFDAEYQVTLAQNDDAPGRDPEIIYRAERDGEYQLRIFAFPETPNQTIAFAGGDNFVYRLSISCNGMLCRALPLSVSLPQVEQMVTEPPTTRDTQKHVLNNARESYVTVYQPDTPGWQEVALTTSEVQLEMEDWSSERPLTGRLPLDATGRIDSAEDVDVMRIRAHQSDKIRIEVQSRRLGFPLDPVVSVNDSNGKQLAKNDDADGRDCRVDFTAPRNGDYLLEVRDLFRQGGEDYLYRLSARQVEPSFAMETSQETFVATVSDELVIPVKIQRRDGFEQAIQIVATGLPATVKIAGATSQIGDDTSAEVKLHLHGSVPCSGPFRIVGLTTDSGRYVTADTVATSADRRVADFWLTVVAKDDGTDDE